MKTHGNKGMSVLRLKNPEEPRDEIIEYVKTVYTRGKPIGVQFTMDGDTYVKLAGNENLSKVTST